MTNIHTDVINIRQTSLIAVNFGIAKIAKFASYQIQRLNCKEIFSPFIATELLTIVVWFGILNTTLKASNLC